jgi:hypothetical protein
MALQIGRRSLEALTSDDAPKEGPENRAPTKSAKRKAPSRKTGR